MTREEIEAALATVDKTMRACAAMEPSNRPALVRSGCTCPTCRPKGRR